VCQGTVFEVRVETRSAFFRPTKAVKAVSATSAEEIQAPVVSSRTASVYWIVLQAVSLMVAMARLTAGSILAVMDTFAPARWAAATTEWP
jgi:hypothetical protein